MKTCCPTVPLAAPKSAAVPAAAPRGFFASLERVINTAGFVSVDLTDTIFASLPRRDGAPYEAVVRPTGSE